MAGAVPLVAAIIMTLSVLLLTISTSILIPQFVPENDQEDAEWRDSPGVGGVLAAARYAAVEAECRRRFR